MFVLYIQYVRTIENIEHYVIVSLVFLIVCFILSIVFGLKDKKWNCASYFNLMSIVLVFFPVLFFVYAIFVLFFGFSSGFWLVLTSIVMLVGAPFIMYCAADN